MTWAEWASATLAGIKAPNTATNHATLTGWMTHEKGIASNWAQWCNPLNTTEPWPGALDSGAQPGAHDVKIYATLANGVSATITTLVWEPGGTGTAYAGIVAMLRNSVPTIWWPTGARSQLDTWGTGQSWLDSVPLAEDILTQLDDIQNVVRSLAGKFWGVAGSTPTVQQQLDRIEAAVNKPEPAEVEPAPAPAPSPIDPQVAADLATIAGVLRKFGAA